MKKRYLVCLFVISSFVTAQQVRKVACIGNSIIFGIGIQDYKRFSYPSQLQRMLGEGWEVRNFGSSGRTLHKRGDYPYWNEKEFVDALAFNPDVVIIKLGTDDSKPQNWKYKDEFVPDYEDFMDHFQGLSSHPRVYVCTPVPAFPGDWGIRDSVIKNEIIPLVKKIAGDKHASVIDLYGALSGKSEFFPDKVHPDEDGARLIAKAVYDNLCKDFSVTKAPEPLAPIPSIRQLVWNEMEYCGFLHFTVNTFTDKEWGYGDESESVFNPTDFNANELVQSAKEAGMRGLILTCKHHDGYCLWQSNHTEHSVKNSPWKNGKGDVVKELADACHRLGLKFGVYLSPWDRNSSVYGGREYIEFYRNQLRELLTGFGDIFEVWFDGANGGDGYYGGAREKRVIDRRTYYGWNETWQLVRQLQPNAVIFSDVGPDIRWVGNENGLAGETSWSMYTPVGEQGDEPAPGYTRYEEGIYGQSDGRSWLPAECDVSIRPGWFYHPSEDSLVKSSEKLFELYFESVGRNASLLLNIPPDRRGRLHGNDVKSLTGLKKLLDETFAHNLAEGAAVTASNIRGNDSHFSPNTLTDNDNETYWATDDGVTSASLILELSQPAEFNVVMLQEYIALGQRVKSFTVDVWKNNRWQNIAVGTTIGHKRLMKTRMIVSDKIRLSILKSRACPTISTFGLYKAPATRQLKQEGRD